MLQVFYSKEYQEEHNTLDDKQLVYRLREVTTNQVMLYILSVVYRAVSYSILRVTFSAIKLIPQVTWSKTRHFQCLVAARKFDPNTDCHKAIFMNLCMWGQ